MAEDRYAWMNFTSEYQSCPRSVRAGNIDDNVTMPAQMFPWRHSAGLEYVLRNLSDLIL